MTGVTRSSAFLVAVGFASLTGCAGEGDSPEAEGTAADPGRGAEAAMAVGGLTPFQTQKAETLLRDRLSCLGCHTLDGEGGRVGPDLSRVGSRLSPQGIRGMVSDPRGTRPTAIMPREPMPAGWLNLVVGYLAGRKSPEPATVDRSPLHSRSLPPELATARHPDGEVLYRTYCAVCHGAGGGGDGPNARYLPVTPTAHADPEYMSRRPDDSLFDAIHAGGRVMDLSHRMPPFGETLSREEIWALVDYMRTLCDCQGPRWSRDERGGP